MKIEITKKKVLYLTVCIALIAVLGLVFAIKPNPGHSWSEIGDLPGTIWHSNNDGSGSGLDADTVDGKHASDLGGGGCQIVTVTCDEYCRTRGEYASSGTTTAVSCAGRVIGGYAQGSCSCFSPR